MAAFLPVTGGVPSHDPRWPKIPGAYCTCSDAEPTYTVEFAGPTSVRSDVRPPAPKPRLVPRSYVGKSERRLRVERRWEMRKR